MRMGIELEEALSLIRDSIVPLGMEEVPLDKALGRALARQWLSFLKEYWPELAWKTAGKRNILALMNRLHLGGKRYLRLRTLLHK